MFDIQETTKKCSFTTKLEDINAIGIGLDVKLSCCLDRDYCVEWYKNKDVLWQSRKFKFKSERGEHQLIIAFIQEEDSGVYFCRCRGTDTSCKLKVEDCSFTTKLEDITIIGIGSDVTLSCCLDKECGVRWYKDKCEIFSKDNFKFKDERFKHQLIIADIQEADSGVYSCQRGRTTTSCKLKVEDCSFITTLEDRNDIGIGSDVTLTCFLDKECGVRWYKDDCEIFSKDNLKFKDERFKHQLIIADIQEADLGVYSCQRGRTKTSCQLKVEDCSFTTKLEDINVIGIGSDVTLSCWLDKKFDVRWYKDREEINLNYKFKVQDGRLEHKLIIPDIQEKDSGVYSCHCGTTKTRCVLKVEDCSFTTQLEDKNVIGIGSDVTLSCCLDKKFDVRWYKDREEINLNYKFKVQDGRLEHKLIIPDIQEKDSGVYSCHCGTTKTRCVLKVEARLWIKRLKEVTITAGENLILECELSAECNNIKWYKTDDAISYRANTTDFKIYDSNAHRYQLEIKDVKIEDAGEYNCCCHENVATCNVTVKEMNIDASSKKTNVLYELKSTKSRLEVKKDEISKTKTGLDLAALDINEKEIIIAKREAEIEEFRTCLEEQENKLNIRESELENKENYMKELENKTQQLTEFVTSLGYKYEELDSAKKELLQMRNKIAKLEGEKKDLEVRIGILESYVNDGKINKQQEEVLEEIRKMIADQKKSRICSIS